MTDFASYNQLKIINTTLEHKERMYNNPELEIDHLSDGITTKNRTPSDNSDSTFRVSLFSDFSVINLYQKRMDNLLDKSPVQDTVEEKWHTCQCILKQAAKESLG